MPIYAMTFWFEHGGECFWAQNETTVAKYDYCVDYVLLPLADELKARLAAMEEEYYTYLDWDYPPDPSPWTAAHKADFIKRAAAIFTEIQTQLGLDYLRTNDVASHVI